MGKGIQDDMHTVIVEHEKMKQDITISRPYITQAQERKKQLDVLISTKATTVVDLQETTDKYAAAIATATDTAKDEAIEEAFTSLSLHNDNLLHKMEQVFACNMSLM